VERIASASFVDLEAELAISYDTEMEATTVSESDWMQERHTALSRSRAYASKSSNASR